MSEKSFHSSTSPDEEMEHTGNESPEHTGKESPEQTGKESPEHTGNESPEHTGKESPEHTGNESPKTTVPDDNLDEKSTEAAKDLVEIAMKTMMEKLSKEMNSLRQEVLDNARKTANASSSQNGSSSQQDSKSYGMEMVELFNPDEPGSNMDKWFQTINELGDINGWTAPQRAKIMQMKLDGPARKWYQKLDSYNYTWEEWQNKVKAAFPKGRDFATMLEELVLRRKRVNETMTAYYHDKLQLCTHVGIAGEQAVSVVIRGLPEELRVKATTCGCTTPEQLYEQFLSSLDDYKTESPYTRQRYVGVKRKLGDLPAPKIRCYNCQELGNHMVKNCPKEKVERCIRCGNKGHRASDCYLPRQDQPGVVRQQKVWSRYYYPRGQRGRRGGRQ